MTGSETSEQYKKFHNIDINNFIFYYIYPLTLSKQSLFLKLLLIAQMGNEERAWFHTD